MEFNLADIPLYKINPKDGSELVLVPGGWFWMGSGDEDPEASDNEKPRHLQFVAPFYLGIACVTMAQFSRYLMCTNPIYEAFEKQNDLEDEQPVKDVDWHEASGYCEWAGLRLPTEAEWEMAARAYQALKFPWGNKWEGGRRVCWYKQKGPKGTTAPVFAHPEGVSCFGCFQQSGNLWEWCADVWNETSYNEHAQNILEDSSGSSDRVSRGASWCNGSVPPKYWYFRGAARYHYDPNHGEVDKSFRVAESVTF
jgi:formylglycine-generating enzyme